MNCEGYKKLLAAVEHDEKTGHNFHNYRDKLAWIVARANQYAAATGLKAEDILDAWEKDRDYWYMNYYQPANQPDIKSSRVRVFDTIEALRDSIGRDGFRCPLCNHVSKSPYECDSGVKVEGVKGGICDWKVYGLFGDMGKGVTVFVKEKLAVQNLFMPLAWGL